MKLDFSEFLRLLTMIGDMTKTGIQMREVRCKYCGSADDVVRFGQYKGVKRYFCKKCQRKFTMADTIFKMKTPIEQIASALSCYYRGMSLDSIGVHLEQQFGNRLTDAGIYNWVLRFTQDAIQEAKKHTPQVGDVWVADETVLKIGGKNVWFWDLIDAKTRFLLASHLSEKRTIADALKLMKMAEARAGKIPELVLTDKLWAYIDGIELAWGAEAKHIPSKGFKKPINTNLIERFHGSLKDRIKVMRGLRNTRTAKLLLDGWLVHYNFFRPHESLGDRTPAEKAGIKSPHKDWMDVVKESKKVAGKPHLKLVRTRASPKKRLRRKRLLRQAKLRVPSLKGVRV